MAMLNSMSEKIYRTCGISSCLAWLFAAVSKIRSNTASRFVLPPHGSVSVRYDTAHEMKLTVGGKSVVLKLGVPSADGKSFQVGIDTVTPERIPLVFTGEEGKISVLFEKKERN